MKRTFILIGIFALSAQAFAQGKMNFHNSSSTLISAGGTPMPGSVTQQFIFAIFLAPSTTVTSENQTVPFTDPAFQIVGAYNSNHSNAVGRLITRFNVDVGSAGGFNGGRTVDFVVRGWSANLGYTWTEFLLNWNNGNPSNPANDTWWGSSTVGNNTVLNDGAAIPSPDVFGGGGSQVRGFNMVGVPEPSTFALVGLSAAALWLSRQRVLK